MEDWTIRRAKAGDADGLGACLDAAYAEYAARIADLPSMSADCAEEIAKYVVWVAETDGVIVAGLILANCDKFMLLANVAVHPDHRGTGLARRLLMLAETEARARGYDELRLTTHSQMPENIRLYARNGWTQLSQQGNKVSMRKVL